MDGALLHGAAIVEAAIFETIPPSGDYEEYDFGDGAGERLWVKFTDDEAREWCGKFSFGWLGKKGKVALLPGARPLFWPMGWAISSTLSRGHCFALRSTTI